MKVIEFLMVWTSLSFLVDVVLIWSENKRLYGRIYNNSVSNELMLIIRNHSRVPGTLK